VLVDAGGAFNLGATVSSSSSAPTPQVTVQSGGTLDFQGDFGLTWNTGATRPVITSSGTITKSTPEMKLICVLQAGVQSFVGSDGAGR
jgi:hypothetical protein